jgi:hypothetical protein
MGIHPLIRLRKTKRKQPRARLKRILSWALFWVFLVACAGFNQREAVSGEDKLSIVESAKKDFAQRLGVREQSIVLVGQIEEVTWPDTSLGCPEPGMMYAQVLTPGYQFTLQSGAKMYEYHTGKGVVKLCNR